MSAMLEIRNASVAKEGARLLENVTLSARPGEFIGLVGPNGAGKSTLMRAIVGLERLHSGDCMIDGARLESLSHRERARRIAYLPQLREVHWGVTVESIVALGRYAFGAPHRLSAADLEAVNRAISASDVETLRNRIVASLSGGERARVHLARTLAAGAPILIADEPTAALDPKHQVSVMEILKMHASKGGLVVAALHDLDLAARWCSRILVLDKGRLTADGAPREALSQATIARVFEVAARNVTSVDGLPVFSFSALKSES